MKLEFSTWVTIIYQLLLSLIAFLTWGWQGVFWVGILFLFVWGTEVTKY